MLWKRMTLVALLALGIAALTISMKATAGEDSNSVTYYKDVLPILQKNCQKCHRPGEIAPMSFMSYKDVRPWAKGIKTAVLSHQMPPWFADPKYGEFRNAPKLTTADVQTLTAWADSGAREGSRRSGPPRSRPPLHRPGPA